MKLSEGWCVPPGQGQAAPGQRAIAMMPRHAHVASQPGRDADWRARKPHRPGHRPSWPSELLTVPSGDDVRLDRVFGRVRGIPGDNTSLVERALALIGVRRAAIAAAAEDDGALFSHGTPTPGKSAFVVRAQVAGRRVAAS